jgi:hypothetical protein
MECERHTKARERIAESLATLDKVSYRTLSLFLPQGERNNRHRCPVANFLWNTLDREFDERAWVDVRYSFVRIAFGDGCEFTVDMPDALGNFVRLFDLGQVEIVRQEDSNAKRS